MLEHSNNLSYIKFQDYRICMSNNSVYQFKYGNANYRVYNSLFKF